MLWSSSLRSAFIVELTVPWEDAVVEAYEQKSLNYFELAADAEKHGWNVGRSATTLLKDLGIRGQALRQAINSLSNSTEKSSRWLWLKRRDNTSAAKQQQYQQLRKQGI